MNYKKVLVLAVGGGNDSVSTLLLQLQLNKTFGYSPDLIDIVAVLPDCLDYHNLDNTKHELIFKINDKTKRSVNGKEINAFPERILYQNKDIFPELKINTIYGLSMKEGSIGILSALKYLIKNENLKSKYDLILSIDVGGDFIAHKDNIDVLSPMMDGYMMYSLKELTKFINQENLKIKMLYSVFGLGTDGESSPEMLEKSLNLISDIKEYDFKKEEVEKFNKFYREIVEKNRYSRTTDYTLKEIFKDEHDNPSNFRARFHIKINENNSKKHYGVFSHYQNKQYYGKYYIFEELKNINNIYSIKTKNGIEWFLSVQKEKTKINHELNGQSYNNVGELLKIKELEGLSLFFGTPSKKFNNQQQEDIVVDISKSILNKVYDFALIYKEYEYLIDSTIQKCNLNKDIVLIGKDSSKTLRLFFEIKL